MTKMTKDKIIGRLQVATVIIALIYFFSFHWLIYPANKLEVIKMAAQIEQLRDDSKNIVLATSEDVVGQVTEMNRVIKSSQKFNSIPVIQLYIPNDWDKIKIIKVIKSK